MCTSAILLFMRRMLGTMVLLYQVLNLAMSGFGVICWCRNFVIMCLKAPGVCSLVTSLARASARSLPLIFVWLGTQCRVVRLPRWLTAMIFVVISGYVRVYVCARIFMAAIECMIVFSCVIRESSTGISAYSLHKTGPDRFSILADTGICVDVYCCLVSVQGRDPLRSLCECPLWILSFCFQ